MTLSEPDKLSVSYKVNDKKQGVPVSKSLEFYCIQGNRDMAMAVVPGGERS
jgi:hypothetical protein